MALFRKNFPMQTFRTVQELKQRTVYSSRCQPSNKDDVCNGATTPVPVTCRSNSESVFKYNLLLLIIFPLISLFHLAY
jgi:hypothetical protein